MKVSKREHSQRCVKYSECEIFIKFRPIYWLMPGGKTWNINKLKHAYQSQCWSLNRVLGIYLIWEEWLSTWYHMTTCESCQAWYSLYEMDCKLCWLIFFFLTRVVKKTLFADHFKIWFSASINSFIRKCFQWYKPQRSWKNVWSLFKWG